jgi:integrase/recombinase XerC
MKAYRQDFDAIATLIAGGDPSDLSRMSLVGRPKLAKTLPKALPTDSVAALLATLNEDPQRPRRSDWVERDRALILTALLAGLRADEVWRANVGDAAATTVPSSTFAARAARTRRVPIESAMVEVLERYLDSRATRFPATARNRFSPAGGLAARSPAAPLFVGSDGDRISRGTLQYRVLRAFRRAGIDADRARGATRARAAPHLRSPPNSQTPTSASTP